MTGLIGSLRGRLVHRDADGHVLVETAGVGHRVQAGPATAARLGDLGDEVFVWVHHHVRDDAEALFGFASAAERDTFEALLGAHGVGPSMALAILSVHDPSGLARVVADEDVAALCLVPGVGKKTAARLLVELASQLGTAGDAVVTPAGAASTGDGAGSSTRQEVRDALAALGYDADEVVTAMRSLPAEGETTTLLRAALTHLAAER